MNYFLFLILCCYVSLSDDLTLQNGGFLGNDYIEVTCQTSPKTEAFAVLRDKCNVCHATKKRTDIFTLNNMDSLAQAIHEQVFIKEKMPKGRKVTLTKNELQILRTWLSESTARAIEHN